MKKILIGFVMMCGAYLMLVNNHSSLGTVFAAEFEIIPKADTEVGDVVNSIGSGGHVRDLYDANAQKYQKEGKLGEAFASGIFTRSLVLDYVVYVIKFLSQIGLLIGALMIIYAGYIYASSVFTGKETGAGNKAIKNAIIGVLVIVFSYAIMKLITSAFIS